MNRNCVQQMQHEWYFLDGYMTCVNCGLVSREKVFVNEDRLMFCANFTKQYVPKGRRGKKIFQNIINELS